MRRDSILTMVIMAAVLVVVAAVVLFLLHTKRTRIEHTPVQQAAFSTPYLTMNDEAVSLYDITADTLVVGTWASWCPTCPDFLRNLADLQTQFNTNEVRVIALNRAEPKQTIAAYVQTLPEEVVRELFILQDTHDTFFASVGGYAVPEIVVYDTRRAVLLHQRGHTDLAAVAAVLVK